MHDSLLFGVFMKLIEMWESIKSYELNHVVDVVDVVDLDSLPSCAHKTICGPLFRYYFEKNSSVESPWISYGNGNRLFSFIGAFSYINSGGYLRDRTLIGRYCSIGRRVTIAAGSHSMTGVTTSAHLKGSPARQYNDHEKIVIHSSRRKPDFTVIESDVWIGDGVIVMPDVKIATGCVVGANSVVTKDTEPYGIYGGVPAKKIGSRFRGPVLEKLLETEWWEVQHEILSVLPMQNIFEFIERIDEMKKSEISVSVDYSIYSVIDR